MFEADDVRATNCEQLVALKYRPKLQLDWVPWLNALRTCEAKGLFDTSTAATSGALATSTLDSSALDWLPAALAATLAPAAPPAGKSWKQHQPTSKAKSKPHDNSFVVESGNDSYEVTPLALGDIDHDGKQDVVLRIIYSPKGGSAFQFGVYVVTRDAVGGLGRVIPHTPLQGGAQD